MLPHDGKRKKAVVRQTLIIQCMSLRLFNICCTQDIAALANFTHIQKTTYHNHETGKKELPFELAVTLARFYDVSLDYIGGLTNDTIHSYLFLFQSMALT